MNTQISEARGYNLELARKIGLDAAVTYNQLLFWGSRSKYDWFYKSYEDMTDETPLSVYELRKAYKKLRAERLIETKLQKADGAPKLHFRLCRNYTMDSEETTQSLDSEETTQSINNKETIKKTQDASFKNQKPKLSELNQAIEDFKAHRKQLKRPMTDKAIDLLQTTLERLAPKNPPRQISIINQSIEHGWIGVFGLKTEEQQGQTPREKALERIRQREAARHATH